VITSSFQTEFNFIHRHADYSMVLALSDEVRGESQLVKRSFSQNKTMIVHQKKGGSEITHVLDHSLGKAYRSERINVERISRDYPESLAHASATDIAVLSGIERCSLEENIPSEVPASFDQFVEQGVDASSTISYQLAATESSAAITFEFSRVTGKLIRLNSKKVISYEERQFDSAEFNLPSACQQMLTVATDPRSAAMIQSTPQVSLYHEKTREDVMEEILANPERRRELGANEDSWLNLRIPGTKW
jgi:hypothetical protein